MYPKTNSTLEISKRNKGIVHYFTLFMLILENVPRSGERKSDALELLSSPLAITTGNKEEEEEEEEGGGWLPPG